MFHFTPFLLPFILAAFLMGIVGVLIWRLPRTGPAFFMLAVVACVEVWTIGFIFEIMVAPLSSKLILANIQFVGIDTLPVAWLALTLTYSGHLRRWTKLVVALLVIPILDQLVIWTDPLHHLFRQNPHIDTTSASFPVLVNDYSYWYYCIQMPYVAIIFLGTTIFLCYKLRFTSGTHRKQISVLLLSTVIPMFLNVLYILDISPIPHFNLSAIGFTTSGLLLSWSLNRFHFLDLMPVARSVMVETLKEAWMVFDYSWRFVDLNRSAQEIIVLPKRKIIGCTLAEVLVGQPELIALIKSENVGYPGIQIIQNQATRYYNSNISPILDARKQLRGRLVVMHDITERVQMEQERELLIVQLQEALAEVKWLHGMLPICANCKNIRDDSGYWHRVEMYIEKHSEVKFSHGICPDCVRELYPDIAEAVLEATQGEQSEKHSPQLAEADEAAFSLSRWND